MLAGAVQRVKIMWFLDNLYAKMKIQLRPLIFCVFGLCLATPALSAKGDKPHRTIISGKRGNHRFQLRFVTGPFRRSSHKTRVLKEMQWIDGKPEWNKDGKGGKNWYGTDGGFPYSEFYSFQVTVDGRKWTVPARLWSDCYEPNLNTRELHPHLSSRGKKLILEMHGSDAAGSYDVIWTLRADGQQSRTFRPTEG